MSATVANPIPSTLTPPAASAAQPQPKLPPSPALDPAIKPGGTITHKRGEHCIHEIVGLNDLPRVFGALLKGTPGLEVRFAGAASAELQQANKILLNLPTSVIDGTAVLWKELQAAGRTPAQIEALFDDAGIPKVMTHAHDLELTKSRIVFCDPQLPKAGQPETELSASIRQALADNFTYGPAENPPRVAVVIPSGAEPAVDRFIKKLGEWCARYRDEAVATPPPNSERLSLLRAVMQESFDHRTAKFERFYNADELMEIAGKSPVARQAAATPDQNAAPLSPPTSPPTIPPAAPKNGVANNLIPAPDAGNQGQSHVQQPPLSAPATAANNTAANNVAPATKLASAPGAILLHTSDHAVTINSSGTETVKLTLSPVSVNSDQVLTTSAYTVTTNDGVNLTLPSVANITLYSHDLSKGFTPAVTISSPMFDFDMDEAFERVSNVVPTSSPASRMTGVRQVPEAPAPDTVPGPLAPTAKENGEGVAAVKAAVPDQNAAVEVGVSHPDLVAGMAELEKLGYRLLALKSVRYNGEEASELLFSGKVPEGFSPPPLRTHFKDLAPGIKRLPQFGIGDARLTKDGFVVDSEDRSTPVQWPVGRGQDMLVLARFAPETKKGMGPQVTEIFPLLGNTQKIFETLSGAAKHTSEQPVAPAAKIVSEASAQVKSPAPTEAKKVEVKKPAAQTTVVKFSPSKPYDPLAKLSKVERKAITEMPKALATLMRAKGFALVKVVEPVKGDPRGSIRFEKAPFPFRGYNDQTVFQAPPDSKGSIREGLDLEVSEDGDIYVTHSDVDGVNVPYSSWALAEFSADNGVYRHVKAVYPLTEYLAGNIIAAGAAAEKAAATAAPTYVLPPLEEFAFQLADLSPGAEIEVVANAKIYRNQQGQAVLVPQKDFSSTLIARDANGNLQEVPLRDYDKTLEPKYRTVARVLGDWDVVVVPRDIRLEPSDQRMYINDVPGGEVPDAITGTFVLRSSEKGTTYDTGAPKIYQAVLVTPTFAAAVNTHWSERRELDSERLPE